jgi:EAL domain-containing protein (putative c-di-GMP-specific phosphodiesterase class I)/GGDEF domain-containing protein
MTRAPGAVDSSLLHAHRRAAAAESLRSVLEAVGDQLRTDLGLTWVLTVVRDPLTLEVRCGVTTGLGDRSAAMLDLAAELGESDVASRAALTADDVDPLAPVLALGEVAGATVVTLADPDGDALGFTVLGGVATLSGPEREQIAVSLSAEVKRAARDELTRRRSLYDVATGLPGPLLLDDVLRAVEVEDEVALLLVSVDQWRAVSRSFGRAAGNEMLRKVAARLLVAGGAGAWSVYRLARGLGVLTVGPPGTAQVAADSLMEALQEPWVLGRRSVRSTCRIGLAVRRPGQVGDSLVECAEAALDVAMTRLRAGVVVHGPEMTASAHESLVLETLLQAGLTSGELRVRYQPQVDMATGSVVGAEALVRWLRPSGLITPDRFLPAAEASGLIVDLDRWVLRTACRQAKAWVDAGRPPLRMAVNVSSRTLAAPGFATSVIAELEASGLDPDQLEVEITETLALFEGDEAVRELTVLREHGVHVAIDDFGTGYSNVGRLRDLPIDRVKIDQCFVRDIGGEDGGAICSVIVGLARTLHLDVIAEGVETEEQRAFLDDLGCGEFQGFLRSPPVEPAAFEQLLPLPRPALPTP